MKTISISATSQGKATLSDSVTCLAWSPKGDYLSAASAAGELLLYRWLDRGLADPLSLVQPDGESVNALGFSADGRFLAAAGQAGELWVWDLQVSQGEIEAGRSFSPAVSQSYGGTWLDQLAWHPQLPQLAYGVGRQVKVWDMVQDTSLAQLDFQSSSALHLAWHPQGDFLAVSGHGGLRVWQAKDWSQGPKRIDVPGASLYGAWSPDGRYLASGNLDRTLTVAEWDSPPPWLMQGFPGKVRQVAWAPGISSSAVSPMPLLAAACLEGITLWERDVNSKARSKDWTSRVLEHHQETVVAIAFQPGSQLLASASQDGTLGLWTGGKRIAQTLKGFSQGLSCVQWESSGELLAAGGKAGELKVWRIDQRKAKGFG